MGKLDIGPACAVAGVAVFSVHQVYTQHAGTLSDARQTQPGDPTTAQRLQDADILTTGLVLVVGGALWAVSGAPHPLILALGALAVVALYYHATYRGSPPVAYTQEDDEQ